MSKKAIRLLQWTIVAVVAFGWNLWAGAGESLKGNDKAMKAFPGSNSCIEAAYSNATSVIEGIVTDEGVISPGPPGEACYESVKIKVARGYKGSFRTNETVTANVFVRTLPVSTAEAAPKNGDTFICFVESKAGKPDRLIKILAATRETRDTIRLLTQNEKKDH